MKISIQGIKSLRKRTPEIEFKPVSFITGPNSAGKSSFTHGMKLLSDNLKENRIRRFMDLPDMVLEANRIAPKMVAAGLFNGKNLVYHFQPDSLPGFNFELEYRPAASGYKFQSADIKVGKKPLFRHFYECGGEGMEMEGGYGMAIDFSELPISIWRALGHALKLMRIDKMQYFLNECAKKMSAKGVCTMDYDRTFVESYSKDVEDDALLEMMGHRWFRDLVYVTAKVVGRLRSTKPSEIPGLLGRDLMDVLDEYVVGRGVNLSVMHLEIDGSSEFSSTVRTLLKSFNMSGPSSMGGRGHLQNSFGALRETMQAMVSCNEDLDVERYLEAAEGMVVYLFPQKDGSTYRDGILSRNSILLCVANIIQWWLEVLALRELEAVKEMEFVANHGLEQEHYFLTGTQGGTMHEKGHFFFHHGLLNLSLDSMVELLGPDLNLEIQEHLDGAAYMFFMMGPKLERTNIGDLGSGQHYLLRLFLSVQHSLRLRELAGAQTFYPEDKAVIRLVLTEPETNLHPSLQAALCRYLVRIGQEENIHFTIETHSEAMIRALQLEIAKGAVKSVDAVIYYFEKPADSTVVRTIKVDSKGMLMGEIGPGFLDESERMLREIRKLAEN